jgi:signal recognition particle GTPase
MGLFGSFFAKFSRNKATPEDLDEFRRVLIESDIGAEFTDEILKLVEKERSEALAEKVTECILSSLSQDLGQSP